VQAQKAGHKNTRAVFTYRDLINAFTALSETKKIDYVFRHAEARELKNLRKKMNKP